ncbi:MAG: GAF domain-containing protein, partial [Planctomycetes bacterium]|nr:GAF domain-containing protein [Planctomycetota bacterium]
MMADKAKPSEQRRRRSSRVGRQAGNSPPVEGPSTSSTRERELVTKLLELLNRPADWIEKITHVLALVKRHAGVEAAAIRAREGDDFTIFCADGFSDSFIRTESHLCQHNPLRDADGLPVLECMCGAVLRGRWQDGLSCFTEIGSFCVNSTTDFLASAPPLNCVHGLTRNVCNKEGYESVALIRLLAGDETVGLLQLNDRRRDCFTPELIQSLERIGSLIGDGLGRRVIEKTLAWEAEVNAALAELSKAMIQSASIDDISILVLEHAKRLTGSRFGFVGFIDPQTGFIIAPTLTRDVWDQCRMEAKPVVFKEFRGLWGWVLNNRKPLLSNNPSGDPRSGGTPSGHIAIQRFLSGPAMAHGAILGRWLWPIRCKTTVRATW